MVYSSCVLYILEKIISTAGYVAIGACGIISILVAALTVVIYIRKVPVVNYVKHRWAISKDM